MKKTILIFLLLVNVFSLFAQSNYKYKVADLATITFPQKPEITHNLDVSGARFTDSAGIYVTLSKELEQDQVQWHSDKLSEFYDNTSKSFINATGGNLISKRAFEIDGFEGLEVEFVSTADPEQPDLRFVRMLLLNKTLITATFWTWSENREATQSARTKFFNSMAITADKENLTQGIDHPMAFQIGSIIGKLSAWAAVIGMTIGVAFLLNRITTRKKPVNKAKF